MATRTYTQEELILIALYDVAPHFCRAKFDEASIHSFAGDENIRAHMLTSFRWQSLQGPARHKVFETATHTIKEKIKDDKEETTDDKQETTDDKQETEDDKIAVDQSNWKSNGPVRDMITDHFATAIGFVVASGQNPTTADSVPSEHQRKRDIWGAVYSMAASYEIGGDLEDSSDGTKWGRLETFDKFRIIQGCFQELISFYSGGGLIPLKFTSGIEFRKSLGLFQDPGLSLGPDLSQQPGAFFRRGPKSIASQGMPGIDNMSEDSGGRPPQNGTTDVNFTTVRASAMAQRTSDSKLAVTTWLSNIEGAEFNASLSGGSGNSSPAPGTP